MLPQDNRIGQGLEWVTWLGHGDLQAGFLSSPLAEGIEQVLPCLTALELGDQMS